MIVLTFKPRFRPQVLDGTKVNTMRADRKRPVKVGDVLSLRGWSARPYMSPQIVLREPVRCTRVVPVQIWPDHYTIGNDGAPVLDLDAFAVRDGFPNWAELVIYFREQGPLPFVGTLIGWAP